MFLDFVYELQVALPCSIELTSIGISPDYSKILDSSRERNFGESILTGANSEFGALGRRSAWARRIKPSLDSASIHFDEVHMTVVASSPSTNDRFCGTCYWSRSFGPPNVCGFSVSIFGHEMYMIFAMEIFKGDGTFIKNSTLTDHPSLNQNLYQKEVSCVLCSREHWKCLNDTTDIVQDSLRVPCIANEKLLDNDDNAQKHSCYRNRWLLDIYSTPYLECCSTMRRPLSLTF